MQFPIRDRYTLTAEYWQSRPLSAPEERRTHPHAAWDAAAPIGTRIAAPEAGDLYYVIAYRADTTRRLDEIELHPQPFRLQGHHYFYDTYGGVIILAGESGMTHVMTHSYANQLYNRAPRGMSWRYTESGKDERWPVSAWHTFDNPERVLPGHVIGHVGNAGFSTGAHVHYEIHPRRHYAAPCDRVDPADIYPQEWEAHSGDSRVYDWRAARDRWTA